MAKCGNCGDPTATVQQIRECYWGAAAVARIEAGGVGLVTSGVPAEQWPPPLSTTRPEPLPTITAGLWRLTESDGTEVIFKVQVSRGYGGGQAGRLYGKRLTGETRTETTVGNDGLEHDERVTDWSFEFAPGATTRLRNERAVQLSDAEAAAYGKLTSMCMFCGKGLNDERSIEAGYGRDCADQRGLPWGATADLTTREAVQ